MPELPEVETVRRGLEPFMAGARVKKLDLRRDGLRFPFPPDFAARIEGRRLTGLGRRAKYLLASIESGETLIMHLGMSGSFRVEDGGGSATPGAFHHERGKLAAHDHVVFVLDNGKQIVFNDPRRFGFMDLVRSSELDSCAHFHKMGVEPLGNAFDAQILAEKFAGRKTPLKAALLDQSLVAGLGNIYVCEALHRTGLSPRRAARTLADRKGRATPKAAALASNIRDVLNQAIASGGSSLRDHRLTDGSLGYFQHNFRVYDREGEQCPTVKCGGVIRRMVQSGRSTFYCPNCQK